MQEKNISFPSIKDVPESAWKRLSKKKIYFGHQSVGFNIMDGIKDVMKENPQIKLNICETYDPDDLNGGIFAHSRIGYNRDPKSKLDAFAFFIKAGAGAKSDFAFFKYCYVDITGKTDVNEAFSEYKKTMLLLEKNHPNTKLIHVTVPLITVQKGFKARLKKILGRSLRGYCDNIKRNQYNQMVRKEYDGKQPIFDLAAIESTFPDGTRSSFTKAGKTYYSLVPDYTHDGGHLNETGRKIVAEQLIILLANLSK